MKPKPTPITEQWIEEIVIGREEKGKPPLRFDRNQSQFRENCSEIFAKLRFTPNRKWVRLR